MCLSSALAIKNIILRNPRWWMAYGETHSVSSWEIFCDFKRNRTADPISLTRFSVISGSRLTVRSKIHWWSSRSMRYRLSNDRRIVHSRRGAMLETTISSYHGPSSSSSSELLLSISITYCQMKKCQNTKSATDTFHGSKIRKQQAFQSTWPLPLAPQIRLLPTTVHIYKLYLLTTGHKLSELITIPWLDEMFELIIVNHLVIWNWWIK